MREAPQDADPDRWHRHFAALANDRAWTLAEQRRDGRDDAELLAAAHAAGDAQRHAESYRRASEALAAIADDEDRELVARTFRQVPAP